MDDITLRAVCPATAAAKDAVPVAEEALAEAQREYAAAAATLGEARALAADPVEVARRQLDPGEVMRQERKAEEIEFSASVKVNTRKQELEAARAEVRRCAEAAAETAGQRVRERLAEIHARFDAGRTAMEQAVREEIELVGHFRGELRAVWGNERG